MLFTLTIATLQEAVNGFMRYLSKENVLCAGFELCRSSGMKSKLFSYIDHATQGCCVTEHELHTLL